MLKKGDRLFDIYGTEYIIEAETEHFLLFRQKPFDHTGDWILVTSPKRREEIDTLIKRKKMHLDTPAARILYGKKVQTKP